MSRLFESVDFVSSCSSDSENDLSSEEGDAEQNSQTSENRLNSSQSDDLTTNCRKSQAQNIILKLYNRERTGYFTNKLTHRDHKLAFSRVPKRLCFCLKEIVPYCYLSGHIFMGLTICGQFLLSYKIISDEDAIDSNYSFNSTYKYELFFWIYRPHNLLCKYYTVCLFDDHGVDNIKNVTITQWKSNPRVLIVHGAGCYENEDSYVSIVAVPRLGCKECKQLRDEYCSDGFDANRCAILCIKCNLTTHTKYCRNESDPNFNPYVNLQCIDRILILASGLIHMVNIDLDMKRAKKSPCNVLNAKYIRMDDKNTNEEVSNNASPVRNICGQKFTSSAADENQQVQIKPKTETSTLASTSKAIEMTTNIVDKIIADFAECETDSSPGSSNFSELVFSCSSSGNSSTSAASKTTRSFHSNRVRLLNHRSNRIISRAIGTSRVGPTRVELGSTSSQLSLESGDMSSSSHSTGVTKNFDKAAKAYEFSEDNEKCEKISTFRKRRLADKKYEFCEENTENIIPYAKMRSFGRNLTLPQKFTKQSTSQLNFFNSSSPPPSCGDFGMTSPHHTHRASPSYGFRSPCGSPVGNRLMMMSPPTRSYFGIKSPSCTRASTMSPRSQSTSKRPFYLDALLENSNHLILSPRSDDCVQPLSEVKPSNVEVRANQVDSRIGGSSSVENDKPMCSIKLIRRYVEEDDAASVITSEEDDCISPGYHTSLPLEVHGAGYSDMQMVSKTSHKKLMCPTVTVTQNTFDLEAFTYYAVNYLCSINNKKYGFFFDCACEIVKICPLSCVLTCILMAHFTASDLQTDSSFNSCVNCTSNLNLDCVFHRKHYECQILFTWDIEAGEWNVIDYGNLLEVSPSLANGKSPSYIHRIVGKLATDLTNGLTAHTEIFNNLHVLDSCVDKSKKVLKNVDNSIEFYRTSQHKRYQYSDGSDID